MTSSRNKMPQVLRTAIEYGLRGLHTSIPARVESYDHARQEATVKPVVNRILQDGTTEELPVISGARVVWPESGGASLTFPVKKGDGCLLVFSERSLDKWLEEGGIVTPDDPRHHDYSDAVAIMGMEAFVAGGPPDNTNVRLQYNNAQLVINDDNKFEIGNDQAQLLALVDRLLQALIDTRILTAIGVQPNTKVPEFQAIKAELAKIKGVL